MARYLADHPYLGKLTLLEAIELAWKLFRALGSGAAAAVTFPFHGEKVPRKYRAHVTRAALRKLTSSLTVSQIQLSTTAISYKTFAKSRGIEPRTVTWGGSGKGHWIGREDARIVVVWFHGGNYYSPAHPAHFEFLQKIVDGVCQAGNDMAVFVPSYSLAPHAQYPAQLIEGLDVLRYLTKVEGRSVGNIVLAGDSAGGNLVLGILSHLSHPHPDIKVDFASDEPFAGALMLCPWVTFDQTWPSIKRNKTKDCVALTPSSICVGHWLGKKAPDHYNEPLTAPSEWWRGAKARRMLLLSGQDDIMVDSHCAFAKQLTTANPHNTEVIVAPDEGHIAPVLDLMLGDRSEFESSKAMKKWLLSC
ncbi:Alpha/Beta hydrolase protein [Aspergillus bertholletiae]|uniref:Alpha/Beta hydrolase protein n=1 Tax=Aspergillus bertholletiae TaxID=1226010 RepID=A0A5N7B2Z7_9EURO|nr:Alpha/Beta hydrolase protein [Aspergillus bertholletiae]